MAGRASPRRGRRRPTIESTTRCRGTTALQGLSRWPDRETSLHQGDASFAGPVFMSSSRRPSKGWAAGFPALAAGPLPFLPPKPGPAAAAAARGRVASSGGGAGTTRGGHGDAIAAAGGGGGDASIAQQQQQQHHQQQMLWQTIHSSDGIPALAELHSLQASLQATKSAAEARKKALAGCEAHLLQVQQQQSTDGSGSARSRNASSTAPGDAVRTR